MSPNLHTEGEGLLETHVTWDEIEEDMQRALGTNAVFGTNKSVKDVGEGNGFLSRMCLIEPDWQNKDDVVVPDKFIVKICTQLTMIQMMRAVSKKQGVESIFDKKEVVDHLEVQTKKLHNQEVSVYNALLDRKIKHIPMPKIYHMTKFSEENVSRGYIIMEYYENLEHIHFWQNLDKENVKEPLRVLAKISAISLGFSDDERAQFITNPFKTVFAPIFNKDSVNKMIASYRKNANDPWGDRIDILETRVNEIMQPGKCDRLSDIIGSQRVLCHGDTRSMNILWGKVNDDIRFEAVIDWQTAHLGCPIVDVTRLLNAVLSGEDRRNHWEELLRVYFDAFEQEANQNGHIMPFDFEQLKLAYNIVFPMSAFMLICMMGGLSELINRLPISDDEKTANLDCAQEKIRLLMDDMFEFQTKYGHIYVKDPVDPK